MKVMLIGFGKINQLINKIIPDEVVGIYSLDENYLLDRPEIIIDFSKHDVITYSLKTAIKYNVPLMIGTTGYNAKEMALISEKSKTIPIVKCSNFSPGLNFILKILKDPFIQKMNSKIIETHHESKMDSPSGTAIDLARVLKCQNIESIRTDDTVGIHEIVLLNDNEKITIKHEVLERKLFAENAILVARWLIHKKPGLYSYEDYLND